MKTFVFEVPRIKEKIVDEFLDLVNYNLPDMEEVDAFHAEKWRFNSKTTIYTIYYKMYEGEDE